MGVVVFLLTLAAVVVVLSVGTRGSLVDVDRFAAVHDLRLTVDGRIHAESYLRRARWYRRWGGWQGFAVGVLASELADKGTPTFTLVTILAGSLLGMVVAEATWGDPPLDGRRAASLIAREPQHYRSVGTRWVERFAQLVVLGSAILAGFVLLADPTPARLLVTVGLTLGAVVSLGLGRWLERRILDRRQPLGDAQLMAVDEQLRAAALESLSAIVIGLLLCLASGLAYSTQARISAFSVTVGGEMVWRATDVARAPAVAVRADALVIEWKDSAGVQHRVLKPAPVSGLVEARPEGRPLVVNVVASLVGVLGTLWAFGEWIRASRTPYLRQVHPQRPLPVPA